MALEHFVADALRAALLLGLVLAAMPLLRRASSATRRLVLALGLGGALLLPALSAITPRWRVETPATMIALRGLAISEPLVSGDAPEALATGGETHARAPRPEAVLHLDIWVLLAGLWTAGACLVTARLVFGLSKARAMVRRGSPSETWSASMARAEQAIGVGATVRVTDELDAPAVTGWLTPVVLVPRASESWSEARRYAVLLHELAHVRQRDCLVHVVAQLACALYWFDPLVWMVARRLRLERELAADDAVILAGARPTMYAEDLLAIAGTARTVQAVPSSALGMAERSQLVTRVTAIVSAERTRGPLTRGHEALLGAGSAVIVLVIACATPAAAKATATSANPESAKLAPPAIGSTIEPRLQAMVSEELDVALREWNAAAGTILVLDSSTGEILANAGRAHGAPADVAIRSAYIAGSTLKVVTLAAALDEELLSSTDRIDCERGTWARGKVEVHDGNPYGLLTLPEVLAVSSNIGMVKVFDRIGGNRLTRWLRAFHLDVAPPIEGAISGQIPAHIEDDSPEGGLAAIGQAVTASPLQIAAAYAVLANGGDYVAPTLSRSRRERPVPREPIMKSETARTLVGMLEGAVQDERATGKLARIAGWRVAGKTGTSSWIRPDGGKGVYSSFVGFVPSAARRVVILVGIEQPRAGESGGKVAAPVFARVASRVLDL